MQLGLGAHLVNSGPSSGQLSSSSAAMPRGQRWPESVQSHTDTLWVPEASLAPVLLWCGELPNVSILCSCCLLIIYFLPISFQLKRELVKEI